MNRMSQTASAAEKKETIETLLEKGMVMITLDARHEEASLPEYLTSEPQLVLNISTRFNLPLDITDWGVHATLTFRGSAFNCEIPWNAIYIMVSHETREPFLFPDDIPVEVVAETIRREREEEEQMQLNEPDRGQGFGGSAQLRLVETDGAAPSEDSDDEPDPMPPAPQPGKRPNHLRVVK